MVGELAEVVVGTKLYPSRGGSQPEKKEVSSGLKINGGRRQYAHFRMDIAMAGAHVFITRGPPGIHPDRKAIPVMILGLAIQDDIEGDLAWCPLQIQSLGFRSTGQPQGQGGTVEMEAHMARSAHGSWLG